MTESPGMSNVIQDLLDQEPFVSFVLVMNSGDRYEVHYPALTFVGKSLMTIARPRSNRHDVLRLTEISSLEVLESE